MVFGFADLEHQKGKTSLKQKQDEGENYFTHGGKEKEREEGQRQE